MSRTQTSYGENRTFSLAPIAGEDLALQVVPSQASSRVRLVDSPENAERIHTQVERLREHIEFHAISRVDLFFYTLIAYWGTRLIVDMGETILQHGICENTERLGMFFNACHSSLFPNLVDARTPEELAAPLPSARTGILHQTAFFDSLNATVALPKVVNQLDIQLEGKRSDDDPLNRTYYRRKALEIIKSVSNGEMNPIDGLTEFLNMLLRFYQDKREYIEKSAITSPTKARKKAWQYSHHAVLSLRGKAYVRRDYIEMLLRLDEKDREALRGRPTRRSEIYLKNFKKIAKEILGVAKFEAVNREMKLSQFNMEEKEIFQIARALTFNLKEEPAVASKEPPKLLEDSPIKDKVHISHEIEKNVGLLSILTAFRATLLAKLAQKSSGGVEKRLEQVDERIKNIEQKIAERREQLSDMAEKPPKPDILEAQKAPKIKVSLEDHAQYWGFECKEAGAGGDCFFHAVLDQLRINESKLVAAEATHRTLREMAVNYILEHVAEFSIAIAGPVHNYILENMNPGAWASHYEVQALAKSLCLTLVMVRSDHSVTVFRHPHSRAVVYLAFTPEIHYQSLVRRPELSAQADIQNLIGKTPEGEWANYPTPASSIPASPIPSSSNLTIALPSSPPESPSGLPMSNEKIYGLLREMRQQLAFLTEKMQVLSLDQRGNVKDSPVSEDPFTTPSKPKRNFSKTFSRAVTTPVSEIKKAQQRIGRSAAEMMALIPISAARTPRGYLHVGSGYKMQGDLSEMQRVTGEIIDNMADDAVILNPSAELIRMLPNQAIIIHPTLLIYCHLRQSIHYNWDILSIILRYYLDEWYDLFITPQFNAKRCEAIQGNAVIVTNENTVYFVVDGKVVTKNRVPKAIKIGDDSDIRHIPQAGVGEFKRLETSAVVARVIEQARILGGHAAVEYVKSDMEDGVKILQNIGFLAFDNSYSIFHQLQRRLEEVETVIAAASPVSPANN